MTQELSVILHGGAGRMSKEHAQKKLPVLEAAREHAWELLCKGSPGEEVVGEVLRIMEDSEYFNAGYGAYPNEKGIVLLDAGMMLGNRYFASVLNVRRLKHPSALVLDMLREGRCITSIWTHEHMQRVDNASEDLKNRYGWVETHEDLLSPFVLELLKRQAEGELVLDENNSAQKESEDISEPHDTVGCVVRDFKGQLVAGTSTGGTGTKFNGRVGDSPIVGAGLFADNEICALSTSGHGESILLSLVSGFIVAEIRRQLREDPAFFENNIEALLAILNSELSELRRKSPDRSAGIILIPARGRPVYAYNSRDFAVALCSGAKDKVSVKGAWISQACEYPRG